MSIVFCFVVYDGGLWTNVQFSASSFMTEDCGLMSVAFCLVAYNGGLWPNVHSFLFSGI